MLKTVYAVDQVLTTGQVRQVTGCWVGAGGSYFQTQALHPETPSYDSSNQYDYIPRKQIAATYIEGLGLARQILDVRRDIVQTELERIDSYIHQTYMQHLEELRRCAEAER